MHAIILALFAFIAMVGLHAMLCRLLPAMGSVKAFVLAGVGVGVPLAITLVSSLPLEEATGGVLVYGGLCEFYVFLFTLILASVGSNMVVMLARGPLAREAILARYDDRAMVTIRLRRMIEAGYLERSAEVLGVTPKGRALARSFARFSAWLGLGAS